jgi:hypothetical protein
MAVVEKMEKTESKPVIAVLDCKGSGHATLYARLVQS